MRAPKFQSNLEDAVHCVPCCVKMVLDYFLPDNQLTISDIEKITGFVPGKGAWEMEELLNYPKLGLETRVLTKASYEEFSEQGFEYFETLEGPDFAQWIKDNTGDIELEKRRAADVVKSGLHFPKVPGREDIEQFLNEGWLVMLAVNSCKLNNKSGFAGHRIVIYDADKAGVTMHDPGPPPHPTRKVDWKLLEDAWADPSENLKLLIAVRKKS